MDRYDFTHHWCSVSLDRRFSRQACLSTHHSAWDLQPVHHDYSDTRAQYFQARSTLTEFFDRLKLLHAECKSAEGFTPVLQQEFDLIIGEFRKACLTKHTSSLDGLSTSAGEVQGQFRVHVSRFGILNSAMPHARFCVGMRVILLYDSHEHWRN